jgi:serine/threonine protein kinase
VDATATDAAHTVLVMEYCNDDDLSKYLAGRGALPVPDRVLVDLLAHMQAATEYLEAKQILHRDIKQENVLRYGIARSAP